MDYRIAIRFLKKARILNSRKDYLYGYNKIRIHNRFETTEHFMAKAMMSFLIFKKGKVFITEADCRNGRVLDILQINKNGEFVSYEIESNKLDKSDVDGVDTFEIKLSKMPPEARKGLKSMEKWLNKYVV